jgi:hypothetical protein
MAHNWTNLGLTAFVMSTLVFAGTYSLFGLLVVIQEAWRHKTWKSVFFYPKQRRVHDVVRLVEVVAAETKCTTKGKLDSCHETRCTYCSSMKGQTGKRVVAEFPSPAEVKTDGMEVNIMPWPDGDGPATCSTTTIPDKPATNSAADGNVDTVTPTTGARNTPRRFELRLDDPVYRQRGPRDGPFAIRRY